MTKINYALSSGSIPWVMNNKRKVEIAKERGFDGVELVLTRRALKQTYEKGLPEGVFSFHEPIALTRGRLFAQMSFLDVAPFVALSKEDLEFLSCFNIPIVCHINNEYFQKTKNFLESLGGNEKSRIVLEFNTLETEFLEDFHPEDFIAMIESFENCEICFDVGHQFFQQWNLIDAFKKLHQKVTILHLSDMVFKKEMGWLDSKKTLGEGDIPLRDFLEEIRRIKWEGQITLELMPWPLASQKKSLSFLREILG